MNGDNNSPGPNPESGRPSPSRLPKRRHRKPRCRACGLHTAICVCPLLPRVDLAQEFLVIQHAIEILRPTNTGRMVAAMLPNTVLMPFAVRGVPFDETPLRRGDTDYLLLFPSDDAVELTAELAAPRPGRRTAFVMLDGTWHQASRMSHRIDALQNVPRVRLPPGPPSSWTIRNPQRPDQLCTLEAAIRVVATLGRAEEADRMLDALELIEARMLYMKGRLPRPKTLEEVRAQRIGEKPAEE